MFSLDACQKVFSITLLLLPCDPHLQINKTDFMKKLKYLALLMLLATLGIVMHAQVKYADKSVNMVVKGTSNLHDWSIKSDAGTVDATVTMGAGDKTATISKLNFAVGAQSFKSGNSGMDKNVYKALQATDHPNITFELASISPVATDGKLYTTPASGKLTVAGVTNTVSLSVNCQWSASDKSIVVSGSKAFKMTDYKVKPPTALFGTIKTGDEITIEFYVKVTR
jgi:polyisoprenoid-binding protein YceI